MYSVLGQDFITSVPKRYTYPYVYSDHVHNFALKINVDRDKNTTSVREQSPHWLWFSRLKQFLWRDCFWTEEVFNFREGK